MEIGDWSATRDLNDSYREIRKAGLETAAPTHDAAHLEALRFRLELYRARKPYRPAAFDGGASFGPPAESFS